MNDTQTNEQMWSLLGIHAHTFLYTYRRDSPTTTQSTPVSKKEDKYQSLTHKKYDK